MAARDCYSYDVLCPHCGQKGVFHVSEDDHPYMRNPHRTVDKIEGNFSASVEGGVDVKATCQDCKGSFAP